MLLTACNYYQLQSTSRRFKENCPRGKMPPSPNSNANPKPNHDPDRGAIFRTPLKACSKMFHISKQNVAIRMQVKHLLNVNRLEII